MRKRGKHVVEVYTHIICCCFALNLKSLRSQIDFCNGSCFGQLFWPAGCQRLLLLLLQLMMLGLLLLLLLLLAAAAGCCGWPLLLLAAAAGCCWLLLLLAAAAGCCLLFRAAAVC